MKYSIFSSLEQELEKAISEMNIPVCLPVPDLAELPLTSPADQLTKMSYLLKFSQGGYYSHLKPDNRYS
jgi:hypothetical protein